MARKKKRGQDSSWKPSVKPETARSIYALVSGIAALLFLLSPLGIGGPAGTFLYDWLKKIFGMGYFLLPVSFAFLAIGLARQQVTQKIGKARLIGALILFLSGVGILSVLGEYGG